MNNNFTIDNCQAILFDFDGVLAECMDVKTEAFAQLFEEFGEDIVNKVVMHHIENGGISRYKKIEYYYKKYLNREITKEEVEDIAQQFSDLVVKKVIESEWVKGAEGFLEKYYKKIDLYVISGTPEEELKKVVEKRNMIKYFRKIYGSPITKPDHIKNIIKENDYDPKKVVYIGDSLSDYKAAKEVNIPFIGRLTKDNKSFFPDDITLIKDFTDL